MNAKRPPETGMLPEDDDAFRKLFKRAEKLGRDTQRLLNDVLNQVPVGPSGHRSARRKKRGLHPFGMESIRLLTPDLDSEIYEFLIEGRVYTFTAARGSLLNELSKGVPGGRGGYVPYKSLSDLSSALGVSQGAVRNRVLELRNHLEDWTDLPKVLVQTDPHGGGYRFAVRQYALIDGDRVLPKP